MNFESLFFSNELKMLCKASRKAFDQALVSEQDITPRTNSFTSLVSRLASWIDAMKIYCRVFVIQVSIVFVLNFSANAEPSDYEVFSGVLPHRSFDLEFEPNSSIKLCNDQLTYFQESLDKNLMWARVMRDSWGNFPSGVYSGNFFDIGNYDQCIGVSHQSDRFGEVKGQHCTLMIPYDSAVMGKISAPTLS